MFYNYFVIKEKTVLCYIEKDHCFLLLNRNKRKNDLNEGKWIGIGGHIESLETPEQALIREVKEETGLALKSYIKRGEILFVNDEYREIMYLCTSNDFVGELIECDEGELAWIDIDKIKGLNLWEGDRYFLPLLIRTDEYLNLELYYKNNRLVKIKRDNREVSYDKSW